MGFSWALYFCQKMVESCVLAAGFSPATLLMDRQRAPSMARDSMCFGGCDRPEVLSAVMAVKATLDAADLQVSEVEADASKQVFLGLQLDHKPGVLSLEASRIWRLRVVWSMLHVKDILRCDQVAKLIGHTTWSCLLRRPALSPINAGYRFPRTFGPRSGRLWPAVAQEFRWIASLLPLLSLQPCQFLVAVVHATDASGWNTWGLRSHAPLV